MLKIIFVFYGIVLMMCKNTMMRKTIRGQISKNANLEKLLAHVYENVGFVFTNEDLSAIRDKLLENKVGNLILTKKIYDLRLFRLLLQLVLVLLHQLMLLFQLK
jgi:ribosomal protein L10